MCARRAAIYARYSSHNQRAESIEIQVEKCAAYCEEQGYQIVRTYTDYAQTGRDIDRLGFKTMMEDATHKMFDVVVCYKITRIMRDRDEMAVARIALKKCGVSIEYAGEDIAEGSAGVLQSGMLEVLAEYESALDSERIRDGIQKNARDGLANGQRYYGYRIVDGRYQIEPTEAAAVKRMYECLFEGMTVAEILRELEPYPTPVKGKPWRFQTVKRMMCRRQYGGEYSYCGVVIPHGMPAIVPMETVERARAILQQRSRPHKHRASAYVLTGRLYHERDKAPMTGTRGRSATGREYRYYTCRECGCNVRQDTVEERAAESVAQALSDQHCRDLVASLMDEWTTERMDGVAQSEVVRAELDGIQTSYGRIWDAIEGGLDIPGVQERIDRLKRRETALRDKLAEAERVEAMRYDKERAYWLMDRMLADHKADDLIRCFVDVIYYDAQEKRIRTYMRMDGSHVDSSPELPAPPPPARWTNYSDLRFCFVGAGIWVAVRL